VLQHQAVFVEGIVALIRHEVAVNIAMFCFRNILTKKWYFTSSSLFLLSIIKGVAVDA